MRLFFYTEIVIPPSITIFCPVIKSPDEEANITAAVVYIRIVVDMFVYIYNLF